MIFSKCWYAAGSLIKLMNGAILVPEFKGYKHLPGLKSCNSSVPVGLRLMNFIAGLYVLAAARISSIP
jgi:hypothetical protein